MAGVPSFFGGFLFAYYRNQGQAGGKRNININVQICIVKGDYLQFCHPLVLGKTFSRFRNTRFRDRSDE